MRTSALLVALSVSCVWAQAPKAQEKATAIIVSSEPDWRFAHSKPDVLLSINLKKILESPAVQDAMKQATDQAPDKAAQFQMALSLVAGIERVQISVRTVPGSKDPDVVARITGSPSPFVLQMLKQPSSGMVSRQLGSAYVLGKGASAEQAVVRAQGAAKPAIADEFASDDIWISGDVSTIASAAAKSDKALPPAVTDMLKRFSLGMNIGDPVQLNLNLAMTNEAGAQQLIALYNMAMAEAAKGPETSVLVNASKIDREGTQVRFRFSASAAALQALAKKKSQDAGSNSWLSDVMMGGSKTSTATVEPAPQQPKNPGKIMIYGLDDGPHEVGAGSKSN